MRTLVVILIFLSFVAMGIFIYQLNADKQEDIVLPSALPRLSPSQTVQPTNSEPTVVLNKNIVLSSPIQDQSVSGSFIISGEARVFENVVSIRVTNQTTGKVLTQTTVYVNAPDAGQFGKFAMRFDIPQGIQSGNILLVEVYQASPKDGTEVDKVKLTVGVK